MPSYKQTLKQTYFPVQAAAASWTAAKASAGAEFSALDAERKALAEIRAARTRYAENLRPRESNDAFVMAALGAVNAAAAKSADAPTGGAVYSNPAFDKALVEARSAAKTGIGATPTNVLSIVAAAKAAKTSEERAIVDALARGVGNAETKLQKIDRPTVTRAQVESGSNAAAQATRKQLGLEAEGAATLLEQAQSSGAMGFEGGEGGKSWFKGLTEDQQRMLALYQSALENDGVVSPGEIPGDVAEAAKLFQEAKIQGGYRRKDRVLYDPSYLRMLQEETKAAAKLAEKEAKVQGKTVEGLSLELYRKMQGEEGQIDPMTGLPIQAASKVPPLLRSIQGDIAAILQAHEASGSDTLAAPQSKGVQAALKLKAGGMNAKAISDEMVKAGLPASDIRQALAFIAADDIVKSYKAQVAPGTDDKKIAEIRATDAKAAQKAELDAIEAAKKAAQAASTAAKEAQRKALVDPALRDAESFDMAGNEAEAFARRDATRRALVALEDQPNSVFRELDIAELDARAAGEAERQRLSESGLVRDRLRAKFGRTFDPAVVLGPTPAATPTKAPEPRLSEEEVDRRIEANLAAEAAAAAPAPVPVRFEMVLDPVTGEYVRKQVGG